MKRLQNTLYVTSEDTYLSLDGENVVVRSDNAVIGRVPLHNLENTQLFNGFFHTGNSCGHQSA